MKLYHGTSERVALYVGCVRPGDRTPEYVVDTPCPLCIPMMVSDV